MTKESFIEVYTQNK